MWTPNPILRPVAALQPDVDRTVLSAMELLRGALGDVDLHHVGSTSLPPLLSGGTVDILALTEPKRIAPCQALVAKLGALQTLPLRVKVIVGDRHQPNSLLRVRHLLATHPLKMGELLGLQKYYEHRTGKKYPAAKQEFFDALLSDPTCNEPGAVPYEQSQMVPHRIELSTQRLHLYSPLSIDAEAHAAYLRENRESHEVFGSRDSRALEAGSWQRFFADEALLRMRREALTFLVQNRDSGEHIGACHFSGFLWGRYQQCCVGYNLAKAAEGHGYMTEAVTAAVAYVVEQWGVHRVQAFYDPKNTKSARLLERVGFSTEGTMASYIKLGDTWHDCTLAAMHTS